MTTEKKTYSEKLKDPRWQKKRLEILQRDNFRCVYCEDEKNTLHVHHLTYGRNPWEVSNDNLLTVCASCHQEETDNRPGVEHDFLLILKQKRINHDFLKELATGFHLCNSNFNNDVTISLIREFLEDKLPGKIKAYYKKENESIKKFLAERERNG